jgi:MoaA/NifB/PqqE/SkfB family radical SAM enzyme
MHKKAEELIRLGRPYELSVPLMKDLISQASAMKIKEIFFVGGEPFIEEKILDVVKYAVSLGMRTGITTNGALLNDEKSDRIFDSGLANLTFSIDGPDKETYGRIRGEGIFETVISNLKKFILKRKNKKLKSPEVAILCTVMRQNIDKLPEMVRFAKNLEVDSIYFQPVVSDNTDQSCDHFVDTWIDSKKYDVLDKNVDALIKLKNGGFGDFIKISQQKLMLMNSYFRQELLNERKCYIGFSRLIVTQDHLLYFCAPDPLTGRETLGDVDKMPLRQLWKSQEAKRFRKYIKKCKRPCLLYCSYRMEPEYLK